MSNDIGMSPTGHGEGPPSDTATPGFEAWGLLVLGRSAQMFRSWPVLCPPNHQKPVTPDNHGRLTS